MGKTHKILIVVISRDGEMAIESPFHAIFYLYIYTISILYIPNTKYIHTHTECVYYIYVYYMCILYILVCTIYTTCVYYIYLYTHKYVYLNLHVDKDIVYTHLYILMCIHIHIYHISTYHLSIMLFVIYHIYHLSAHLCTHPPIYLSSIYISISNTYSSIYPYICSSSCLSHPSISSTYLLSIYVSIYLS